MSKGPVCTGLPEDPPYSAESWAERTAQAEDWLLLAPGHRQLAGKSLSCPSGGPPCLHARSCLGCTPPARVMVPSSHSARHGPRSRGGKTQQSPRRAQHGHPRQVGVSGRAGSGRAPRRSWSCCSGCACWWTARSESGSGYRDNRGQSVRSLGFQSREREAPASNHRPLEQR